jgi:N-terminal region of glycosyl transferase group 7
MPDDRTITMPHRDVLPAVTRRLHIVVPYRDRETHLRAFLPHMRSYFSWDESGWDIPYWVTIVEQEEGLPFNRGAIKNIGFLLAQDSDYTCFHDIDYLPVSADYSWAESPTGIVWFGAEEVRWRLALARRSHTSISIVFSAARFWSPMCFSGR